MSLFEFEDRCIVSPVHVLKCCKNVFVITVKYLKPDYCIVQWVSLGRIKVNGTNVTVSLLKSLWKAELLCFNTFKTWLKEMVTQSIVSFFLSFWANRSNVTAAAEKRFSFLLTSIQNLLNLIPFFFLPQLTLYAQKFDEFQATLAKSNEIYVRFKKEMDNVGGDDCMEARRCESQLLWMKPWFILRRRSLDWRPFSVA